MNDRSEQGPVALGFRASRGGSVVVAVAADRAGPRLLISTFLATAEAGDRLAFEPYHVAAERLRAGKGEAMSEAAALVAEGRLRQADLAAAGLEAIVRQLEGQGRPPAAAALLVNRAGWITDLLQYSLGAVEHPPVAEGLAVRDALRAACAGCGLGLVELDEKSLPETASARLGLTRAAIDQVLAEFGAAAGRPWRKEQKLAALAAWVAAS